MWQRLVVPPVAWFAFAGTAILRRPALMAVGYLIAGFAVAGLVYAVMSRVAVQ